MFARLISYFKNKVSVPFKSDALFRLDGTISGNYFIDKSGNNKNFLITDKDFDADWTKGMPYKTAATISAPVGDAVLIAADINNYLYTSNGTPNQIPVISLYQDIDYAHKLFTRHGAQRVDTNGVETYEARVIDIVLYASVKTGADLVRCNSYYGVPTEITTNVKWVDFINGLDTNDGTKNTPYKTVGTAIANISTGGTIYVKSSKYTTTTQISVNKECIIQGLPMRLTSTNGLTAPISGDADDVILNNIDITPLDNVFASYSFYNCNYNKIRVVGSGRAIRGQTGKTLTIKNSIVTSVTTTGLYLYDNTIIENSLYNITTKYFETLANIGTLTLKNNKFIGTDKFIKTASATISNIVSVGNTYNGFTSLITGLEVTNFESIGDSGNINGYLFDITTPLIGDFSFNQSNFTGIVNGIFVILRNKNITINDSIFKNTQTNINLAQSVMTISTDVSTSIFLSLNNSIFDLADNGRSCVEIGDGNYAITNKITGSITKCKFLGHTTELTHGLAIWANDALIISKNYFSGLGLALVLKGRGINYINTNVSYNVIKNGRIVVKAVNNQKLYNNVILIDNIDSECIHSVVGEYGNQTLNTVIKNNILVNTFNTKALIKVDVNNTFTSDYNCLYNSNGDSIGEYNSVVSGFVNWKILTYDINSINQNPNLDIKLMPLPNIAIAEILESPYNVGLDALTNWGLDTELPSVVTKNQNTVWDIGAYIF